MVEEKIVVKRFSFCGAWGFRTSCVLAKLGPRSLGTTQPYETQVDLYFCPQHCYTKSSGHQER